MRQLYLALATLVFAMLAGRAEAQIAFLPEIRGGVLAHSVDEPGPGSTVFNVTRIEDANVELLFDSDLSNWVVLGELRPHVGATVNFSGRESMIYAGLSWTFAVPNLPVFVEASFGGAVHNGELHNAVAPARSLGCPVLFRESASLGWQITSNASIMATVEHASHAGLCGSDNRGLTNVGVRLGYRF